MATDLVGYGLLNQYDTAYLMTGDADFLQALFFIKKHNSKITVKIICLDKKIMYKGAFYFDTFILNFSNQRLNFHPKQKIKIINIKNPAELCQRVG